MTRFRLVLGVWLAAAPWACPALASEIAGLVAFGDSLSDTGNVYQMTFGLYPASPYYQGRFSNGPVWAEQLAARLVVPGSTSSWSGGDNWAYGGARTGSGYVVYYGIFRLPNLGTQIGDYLAGHVPASDQLFLVWGGANDFLDGQTDPAVPVANLAAHVTALAQAGATQFLVPNLPPLGQTPQYRGTTREVEMDTLSYQFNALLAAQLDQLRTSLGVSIRALDTAGLFEQVLDDPAWYGLANVTDSAYNSDTGEVVADPDAYLFWDDLHPTRVAHRLLGDRAAGLVDPQSIEYTWDGTVNAWSSQHWQSGGRTLAPSGDEQMLIHAGRVEVAGQQVGQSAAWTLLLDGGTLDVSAGAALQVYESATIAGGTAVVDGALAAAALSVLAADPQGGTPAGVLAGSGTVEAATVYVGGILAPGEPPAGLGAAAGLASVPEPSVLLLLTGAGALAVFFASARRALGRLR